MHCLTRHREATGNSVMISSNRKPGILHRLIVSANEASDLSTLLEAVLALTLEMLGFDGGGIYLADEKRGVAELQCFSGLPDGLDKEVRCVDKHTAPYSRVFIQKRPIFADDYERLNPDLVTKFGMRSVASIPLITRNRVIGALNVLKLSPHHFTGEEKDILNSIGRETAAAVSRMQSEVALRESERQFKELTDAIPETVYEIDKDGRITFVNRNAFESYGYSPEDVAKGINVLDLIAPEDLERAAANFQRIVKGDRLGYVDYKVKTKDGRHIPVSIISIPIMKNKEIRGFRGLVIDLRERKKSEELKEAALAALKRERDFSMRLIQASPAFFVAITPDGRVLMMNESMLHTLGFSADEVKGKKYLRTFVPEEERAELSGVFPRIMNSSGPSINENHVLTKDGKSLLVEWHGRPIFDARGEVEFFFGIGINITERKKAESQRETALDELAAEKERLAVTLYSIGEGVITANIRGKVVLVNRIAEELTGWKNDEAAGHPIDTVFSARDGKTGKPVTGLATRLLVNSEIAGYSSHAVLNSRSGTERLVAASGAPIRDRSGAIMGTVLVFRDITESITMEQELLKARNLESLSVLAGGIAHDFNNILTVILGNISLAKMQLEEKSVPYGLLIEAEKASQRARDLTQQLLTFSKGGAPIKKVTSIEGLLRDTVSFMLSGSNIRSRFSIPENLWPVRIDEGQISQVINNLVINAQHAMPTGGTIEIKGGNIVVPVQRHKGKKLSPLPLRSGKYVKITIRDHGLGIPPEHITKIFDPYFTTMQKGSGLGLATAYSIIQKHDGHIGVESQVGSGSIFTIYLPATEERPRKVPDNIFKLSRQKGRILLMDDDVKILNVASAIIEQIGYETETSLDGADAIKKYADALKSRHPFDAVIMDLTVPGGMGGREAVRKLREIDPAVKAIVSSGYSNDPVISDYKKFGFSGVVSKPYTIREMSAVIRAVVSGSKKRKRKKSP